MENFFYQDISKIVGQFEARRNPYSRYASFDYSYNYFHPSNKNNLTEDMEKSCLALGFYLASWGMFRGSGFLLNKSSKHFYHLVEYIDELKNDDQNAWGIDADKLNDENIDFLIEQYHKIKEILVEENHRDLVLVTKVMLGVFASVPAYDDFFTYTFKNIFKGECAFSSFNEKSLECIKKFYDINKSQIDKIEIYTIDFNSEKSTNLKYTKSKIIDMYGFQKDKNRREEEEKKKKKNK